MPCAKRRLRELDQDLQEAEWQHLSTRTNRHLAGAFEQEEREEEALLIRQAADSVGHNAVVCPYTAACSCNKCCNTLAFMP